jgi:hypothetical protein
MANVFNPRVPSNNVPASNTRPTPMRGTTNRPRPATYKPRRIQSVEYRRTPNNQFVTPRYNNYLGGKIIYDYFSNKKNFPRGISPTTISANVSSVLQKYTGGKPLPYTIPDSEKYLGSFDMFAFAKPGVPGATARLADVRSFIDSKGAAFNLTQADAQKMINQGLMAYVKTEGSNAPRTITVASPVALQQFLSDNYKAKKARPKFDAGGVRVYTKEDPDEVDYNRKKPNYNFSDSLEYYQNIYGLNPRSTAFNYDRNAEKNVKRSEVKGKYYIADPEDPTKVIERKTTDVDYNFDFKSMGDKYAKFIVQDEKWRGKIVDEIKSNGGDRGVALFNKLQAGRANTAEVNELKRYMFSFSPQGSYADVQNTFINNIQGTDFSQISRTLEEERVRKPLIEEAQKQRALEAAATSKANAEFNLEFFDKRIYTTPTDINNNLYNVISSGRGSEVSLSTIPIIRESIVTDADKVRLIQAVSAVGFKEGAVSVPLMTLAQEYMNELGNDKYDAAAIKVADASAFREDPTKYLLAKLASVGSGTLSPTPASEIRSNLRTDTALAESQIRMNLTKGILRATLSAPAGLYALADNPTEALTAMADDYKYRYGSVEGFANSTLEDPLMPILDLMAVVPAVGWAAKSGQLAKIATTSSKFGEIGKLTGLPKTSRLGLSPREFARVQRQRMVGTNPNVDAILAATNSSKIEQLMLGGYTKEQAINISTKSTYVPTAIDRAAALFEPRYVVLNAADGIPDSDVAAVVQRIADEQAANASNKVYVRMAGNPLSRSFQTFTLNAQKQMGSIGWNLPLIGFQYRYGKALREGNPIVSDAASREFMVERKLQTLQASDLDDAEQMAAWYAAGGESQGYAAFTATINRRLEEVRAARDSGIEVEGNELKVLEVDYDRYMNPEFEARYRSSIEAMLDVDELGIPRSERGRKVAKMRDAMILLSERNNRILTGEADPRTLAAFQRTYALVLTASKLLPEDVVAELGKDGSKVLGKNSAPILNPNIRLTDMLDTVMEDLPNSRGEFVDTSIPEVKTLIDKSNAALARLNKDLAARDSGGSPVVFMDPNLKPIDLPNQPKTVIEDVTVANARVESKVASTTRFYPVRALRVQGLFDDSDMSFDRKPLLGDDVIYLPEQFFATSRTGKLKYHKPADARINVEIAIANKMHKMFPNARDFIDKISTRDMRGMEDFDLKINRNEVIRSGLASYQFDVQLAGSARATARRVQGLFDDVINEQAIPITVKDYLDNVDAYVPIITQRVFDTLEAAEAYANDYRHRSGMTATDKGVVESIMDQGIEKFKVTMNYIDIMSTTLAEHKSGRLADWETDLSSKYVDTQFIELMDPDELARMAASDVGDRYAALGQSDPNSTIMVIPRGIYNKFGEASRRSNRLSVKTMQLLSSLFKMFVLAMSPRFIQQNIFGTNTMLMLARPEMAVQVMADMFSKGAKNALKQADKLGQKLSIRDREQLQSLSELGTDTMILKEIFPDDFDHNILMEDKAQLGSYVSRAVNGLGKRAPSVGKFIKPLLNNKAVRLGGKVGRTVTSFGYIITFAYEAAMRTSILKQSALSQPLFKAFMDSDVVAEASQVAIPGLAIDKMTKFHTAMRMIADPNSPYYNEFMLREMRYTADSVVGNYRWFSPSEKFTRNFLLPFYAWTRHSALFTKRLLQDRPITANLTANLGNYGYEEILEAGGLPNWLLGSIPFAGDIADKLGFDPNRINVLNAESFNPYATTGRNIAALGGFVTGDPTLRDIQPITAGTNPYVTGFYSRSQGVNPLTGYSLREEERNKSALQYYRDMYAAFPAISLGINLFKTEDELNTLRNINSVEDFLADPEDPTSTRLSLPKEKLTSNYSTTSMAGIFNAFSPSRVVSLGPTELDKAMQEQARDAGLLVAGQAEAFKSAKTKAINALEAYRRAKYMIENVLLPTYGKNADPAIIRRIMQGLADMYPSDTEMGRLTADDIDRIMNGGR